MKKRGRIYSVIIAAAAGLLLASCKPVASGQFGTLVIGIAGGNERAIGTNGLPELNSSHITFTVTKTGGPLIKEQTYRPDESKTCTVTLPVGEKITVRVRLTNASAEWVGTTEHTVQVGANPVSVKLRKKAAALHSFVFSTHRNGSTPGTVSFTLKLKGQNDSLHDLLTTPLTEKTHPYFVRDNKGSIYLVYAESSPNDPNALAWKMRVYDSEGKNPKQIELPNAGTIAFAPAADFTTGTIYAASDALQRTLYRLDGGAFTHYAPLHCTARYAVDNKRLVYIERTADSAGQQPDRFSLKLYSDISQSFQNPDQPVQVSAEKDITEDIRITGSTQPQITDICIHGDYVYLLFSAGQSGTGRFYRIGGLVRYKLTQTSTGITIGNAEAFGFEKTPRFKEMTIQNLTDANAKTAVLENYGYETRFYTPIRFIGFDAENLYIADDGIAFSPTEGTVLPIQAEDRDRIAVFNTAEASLSFDPVPQGTTWIAYADESIYAKVPYTDLARYLTTQASATDVNYIEITGSIPIADFQGTGTNPGELGKTIKAASAKKIVLKLPEGLSGVTDMSYCFNQCTNLVSVRNIPNDVTNMSNCFNGCSSLVEAPTIPASVTNMSECFKSCKNVTKAPDIPASVTEMRGCFQFCEKLTLAPVILANVTNMSNCFYGCTALTKAPAIPANVTNMSNCFYGCTALTKAPAIPPDSQLTNMSSCFDQCTALTEAPLIPARVTDMSGCFNGCTALTKAPAIPDGITNMSSCFFNCSTLTKGPDIPASVRVMRLCFSGCTRMEGVTLDCNYNSGSSSGSPDFQDVFAGCTALQDGCIQVKTAHYAAYTDTHALSMMGVPGSTSDEQKAKFTAMVSVAYTDLARYLTTEASATDVNYIEITGSIPIADFQGTGTNPGELGKTIKAASTKKIALILPKGLSGVTDMKSCFKTCTNLVSVENIPDTVTNMSSCFQGCTKLQQASAIPASVTNMQSCFKDCKKLERITLNCPYQAGAGYTGKTFTEAFDGCTALRKDSIRVKAEHYAAYTKKQALTNMKIPGRNDTQKKEKFKKVD